MASSGMLRRVALVRTDVSEELSASIRVTRIDELGTTRANEAVEGGAGVMSYPQNLHLRGVLTSVTMCTSL
jgi:hypothetical protein